MKLNKSTYENVNYNGEYHYRSGSTKQQLRGNPLQSAKVPESIATKNQNVTKDVTKEKEILALLREDAHIIYVNGEIKDSTPLGKLMHDFSCTNPEDMNYKELADRTRYINQKREVLQNEIILSFLSSPKEKWQNCKRLA